MNNNKKHQLVVLTTHEQDKQDEQEPSAKRFKPLSDSKKEESLILNFPQEILERIFLFLVDARDLVNLEIVCKTFYFVVQPLWKLILNQKYSDFLTRKEFLNVPSKKLFLNLERLPEKSKNYCPICAFSSLPKTFSPPEMEQTVSLCILRYSNWVNILQYKCLTCNFMVSFDIGKNCSSCTHQLVDTYCHRCKRIYCEECTKISEKYQACNSGTCRIDQSYHCLHRNNCCNDKKKIDDSK